MIKRALGIALAAAAACMPWWSAASEPAKEKKSFTAKDAKVAKEKQSLTAKDAKENYPPKPVAGQD